ncbi:hypothetical protein PBAL39_20064 [Pedobacter sp. BAL39]|uniref:hypothetical protein n=1 Tax=Pedobacter sp. BAL39 TaxID=391596 RepID=UPI000155983A|nr:hypothetical protein [Pedobacter sp. BAL39]EDM36214.1 hypothetical protein PBAL39_20064 [Pedobacter sp. BAL39]
MKLPGLNMRKVKADLKTGISDLATGGFQQIFKHIDQLGIKKGVDSMGIDRFINQCALMAAGSGVITGIGGLGTAVIGMPLDVINLITQQFRVTLAISYHTTGRYSIRFEDFFKIVASSVKADAKLAISKNIMEEVAEKILMGIGSRAARRLVPVVGAVIGGTVNYLFIKRVAEEVKVE